MTNSITLKNLRIFIVSALLVFIMVVVQRLGLLSSSQITSPQPNQVDILDSLRPKLEQKVNQFQLIRKTTLIPQAYAGADFDQARAYLVVDAKSGEILVSQNSTKPLPMASLTKVMTAIVALDIAKPRETFTVSPSASTQIPTKLDLKPGDKLSLEDLLNGLLLVSANDCAQVIKEGIDQKYGSKVFIKAMNVKATFLGLKNSHFTNPQGFDDDHHYSSAEDLAVLSQYALTHYSLIFQIAQKDHSELFPTASHPHYEYLNNWNSLVGIYPGAYGVKIGNTDAASKTIIAVSERDGHHLLTVVLGAPDVLSRDLWASQLLDLGFSKYGITPANITESELKARYARWKYFDETTEKWR